MRTSLLARLGTGELLATVLLFVAVTFAALGWQHWQRRRNSPLRVTALFIYPIKSCAAVPVPAATFGRLGFRYDRQWMLVNSETGRMLTAREVPHLQQIKPRIDEETQTMSCTFALQPEFGTLTIPLQPPTGADAKKRGVDLWDSALEAVIVSEEASRWFNKVVHWSHPGAASESPVAASQRYELVTVVGVAEHARPLPPEYDSSRPADKIAAGAFSDGFPFLVCSESSLHDLNRKYCTPAGRTVEMIAFRPNIVVAGGGLQPWEEDYWRTLEISAADSTSAPSGTTTPGLRFSASKPCGRCVLTTVVPGTGQRHPTGEPLLSLRAHRQILAGISGGSMDEEAIFGQNLIQLQQNGRMRVGDLVRIVEKKPTKHEFVRPPKEKAAKKAE